LLGLLAREFAASGFDVKHLYRCMCLSGAYQRTSRPVPGNERDEKLFGRMAVKPVGPEALYDSLLVVYGVRENKNAPSGKPGVKPTGEKPPGVKPGPKPEAGKPMPPKPDAAKPDASKPMPQKPEAGKPSFGPSNPREEFALFFRGEGGAEP